MEIVKYENDVIQQIIDNIRLKQKRLRRKRTDRNKIKFRAGKGGMKFQYVSIDEAFKWLDENYPIFSIEAGEVKELAGTVNVLVRLEVIDENGIKRVVQRWGTKEAVMSQGNLVMNQYIKAAETDGLKRCLVALGAFNDVYYDVDVYDEVSDDDKVDLVDLLISVRDIIGNKAIYDTIVKFESGAISMKQIREKIEKLKSNK